MLWGLLIGVLVLNGVWVVQRWRHLRDNDLAGRRNLIGVLALKLLVDSLTVVGMVVALHLLVLASHSR